MQNFGANIINLVVKAKFSVKIMYFCTIKTQNYGLYKIEVAL